MQQLNTSQQLEISATSSPLKQLDIDATSSQLKQKQSKINWSSLRPMKLLEAN